MILEALHRPRALHLQQVDDRKGSPCAGVVRIEGQRLLEERLRPREALGREQVLLLDGAQIEVEGPERAGGRAQFSQRVPGDDTGPCRGYRGFHFFQQVGLHGKDLVDRAFPDLGPHYPPFGPFGQPGGQAHRFGCRADCAVEHVGIPWCIDVEDRGLSDIQPVVACKRRRKLVGQARADP